MELAKHCTSSRPDASEECKVRMDKRMQQRIWEAEENFSLATKLWLKLVSRTKDRIGG